jgi:hypothetical protein
MKTHLGLDVGEDRGMKPDEERRAVRGISGVRKGLIMYLGTTVRFSVGVGWCIGKNVGGNDTSGANSGTGDDGASGVPSGLNGESESLLGSLLLRISNTLQEEDGGIYCRSI